MKLRHVFFASLLAAPALALPPAPELPEAPAKLKKQIATVSKRIDKVMSDCQDTGERNPGEYDARCPSWLARINKSGKAATWALYDMLLGEEEGTPAGLWGASETEDSLYGVLVADGSRETVIALIRAVHRAASGEDDPNDGHVERFLDTLSLITGDCAVPYKASPRIDAEVTKKSAEAWVTWWDQNKDKSTAEWRAAGLERARTWVNSTDMGERWHAAQRLLEKDGDLPAAQKAIIDALASPDLPAEYKWTYASLAYTAKLTQAQVEAAQTARRKVLIARGDEDAKNEQQEHDNLLAANALLDQCQRAYYELRLEESRSACAKAVQLDDTNILSRIGLAWAEFDLGNTDAAQTALDEVVDRLYEDGADDVNQKVWQLQAAILTVNGSTDEAKESLHRETSEMSQEMRSRLAILEGRPAPATWVAYVAPRYFCWKGKGESEANGYLLRRGFLKPEQFNTAFTALPSERRKALEESARTDCPWKAVVSGVETPRS